LGGSRGNAMEVELSTIPERTSHTSRRKASVVPTEEPLQPLIPAAAAVGIRAAANRPPTRLTCPMVERPKAPADPAANPPTKETVVVLGTLVLLVVVVVAVGGAFLSHSTYQRDVNQAVSGTMSNERYADLRVTDVSTEYVTPWVTTGPTTVTVTVSRTDDRRYPSLPTAMVDRIAARTGVPVTVQVEYVEYDTANASRARV